MKTSETKNLNSKWVIILLYLTTLILISESCAFTWIGRAVGGDIGRPSFSDYTNGRIIKVSPKKINYGGKNHVEVHKTDSLVLVGKFNGFTAIPAETYKSIYNRFLDSVSWLIALPFLGEMVVANEMNHKDKNITGSFEGFNSDGFKIKSDNYIHALPFSEILRLTNIEGYEYDLQMIKALFDSNRVPLGTGVFVLTNINEKIIIPIEEIAYARCQKSERNGKLIGTAVGALIDVAIVVLKTRDSLADNTLENKF
jgi:hypothetical protein